MIFALIKAGMMLPGIIPTLWLKGLDYMQSKNGKYPIDKRVIIYI